MKSGIRTIEIVPGFDIDVDIINYESEIPEKMYGHPDTWSPGYDASVEFEIVTDLPDYLKDFLEESDDFYELVLDAV